MGTRLIYFSNGREIVEKINDGVNKDQIDEVINPNEIFKHDNPLITDELKYIIAAA